MEINAELLQNNYYRWLQSEEVFSDIENNLVAISTPFVDAEFDNINLYAQAADGFITVTDLGYTLYNLEVNGVAVEPRSRTRYKIFTDIINAFGVSENSGRLEIKTTLERFPIAKNRLLQALMRINDLEFLATNNVKSAFNDVLTEFFDTRHVYYTAGIEIPGVSGVSSFFDFAIPNNKDGERLVKTVARPNDLNQAKAFNFDVQSVSAQRPDAKFVYLVDNVSRPVEVENRIRSAINAHTSEGVARLLPYSALVENNEFLVNE
jgi:hypothetical protein